mgnify:CR=1 FL=1
MGNIDSLTGSQKELALKYRNAGRDLVGDGSLHDYIVYEMGHHVEWDVLDAKTNNLIGSSMSKYAPHISGYANASKGEYIGESFVAYSKGETDILDPEFVKFMKSQDLKWQSSDVLISTVHEKDKKELFTDITDDWTKVTSKGSWVKKKSIIVKSIEYKVDGKFVTFQHSEEEIHIAKVLSEKYAKKVYVLPKVNYPQGVKTHDYKIFDSDIEVPYDLKTSIGNSKNTLYDMISKKKEQSEDFIFDLSKTKMSIDDAYSQINSIYKSKHTNFVQIIVVMKDDKILRVLRR